MIKVDSHGRIVLVNKQAERMFGYERNELIGQTIEVLIPQRFHRPQSTSRASFFAHPSSLPINVGRDFLARRKDGTEFPVEIGLNPVHTFHGDCVLSSIVDVTERKKEEERFRLVVEAAPNGMILVDESGKIILVNQLAERMFGYSRNELLGEKVELLIPERYRSGHPTYRGHFFSCPSSRAMGGGRDLYGRRKDGSEFPVEIGINPMDTASSRCVLSSIVDITERKRYEKMEAEQLVSRREVLEARARMEFLATMSHEIRTPLTSIVGSVELLQDTVFDEPTTQCFTDIQRCSNVLLTVINNILDWSKLEAGSCKSDRIVFNLRNLLQDVNGILAGEIRSKALTFTIHCEECVPKLVVGDQGRLSQILLNLCYNAVKFTDSGGVVVKTGFHKSSSVGTSPRQQYSLTFEVSDSGHGMSTDFLSRLFQPFTQADNSTTRRNSGTGLGLAIVKKLVTLLGGSIVCESKLGFGTTFRFDILIDLPPSSADIENSTPPLSPHSARLSSVCSLSYSSPFTSSDSELQQHHNNEDVHGMVHCSSLRILVVEDIPVIQRIVRAMLTKLGYSTDAVSNGLEAVKVCEKEQYALILMDCEMPIMDGFEATAQIKQQKTAPPIIAMTANALMGDRERCLKAGMDAYLSKPVRIADLRLCLDRVLSTINDSTSEADSVKR